MKTRSLLLALALLLVAATAAVAAPQSTVVPVAERYALASADDGCDEAAPQPTIHLAAAEYAGLEEMSFTITCGACSDSTCQGAALGNLCGYPAITGTCQLSYQGDLCTDGLPRCGCYSSYNP